MVKKLQQIIFPEDETVKTEWLLFYRGCQCVYGRENEAKIYLPAYRTIDFATYLNGFSNAKWKEYTNLGKVSLYLVMKGVFTAELVAYSFNGFKPQRKSLLRRDFDLKEKAEICLEYPQSEGQMLSFELHSYSGCEFYDGWYAGEYQKGDVNAIELAVATTTCHKEEYIIRNIGLLKREILESGEEVSRHIHIHVIDNGRTLVPEEYNCERLAVHPNKNTGGSGGFARGMIEALHQDPAATHILLMDDDVLLLPESLKRTYTLLSLLKPEYAGHMVAGGMLALENMCVLHEDLGRIKDDGEVCPRHRDLDVSDLSKVLQAEEELPPFKNEYGAWWYCCIPMEAVRENGLPLPLFIRGDDIEYGLRCGRGFLTMNGICVWHMGFLNKYNPAIDIYQVYRNMLIIQALGRVCQGLDFMRQMKRIYRQMMLEFNYGAAELVLRALEDYARGPAFLMQERGEQILKENSTYQEQLAPIREFSDKRIGKAEICLDEVYGDPPRKRLERWIYRLTFNGHRCYLQRWLRKQPAVIGYDWSYQPQRQSLRKYLLSVNTARQTMALRVLDKQRYKALQKRYRKILRFLKREGQGISKQYAQQMEELVSEGFWRKYLGL